MFVIRVLHTSFAHVFHDFFRDWFYNEWSAYNSTATIASTNTENSWEWTSVNGVCWAAALNSFDRKRLWQHRAVQGKQFLLVHFLRSMHAKPWFNAAHRDFYAAMKVAKVVFSSAKFTQRNELFSKFSRKMFQQTLQIALNFNGCLI